MELITKFYRKIVPNINYVFTCDLDFLYHNLNMFSVNQCNIILIPLSNFSSEILKKLYEYIVSILKIYVYHYGEHKPDDSFLPKTLKYKFIFSNNIIINLFKEIIEKDQK